MERGLPAAGEVSPREALELMARGARLVDVRDAPELLAGTVRGAIHIARCELMQRVAGFAPDTAATLLLICASGVRSRLAATQLAALGYSDVRSVAGGLARWQREGLPVESSRATGDPDWERYARQLALPEVGEAGQRRLMDARVLLVGAGGLGSPAALYLAAAGVGHLTLVDDDRVERSNLQRQVLHRDASAGESKVLSGVATLRALNPSIEVTGHDVRLSEANARELLSGQHVVIDGSDNFATRYVVNDACVALGIACVHGSVFRFEGQVSVFWPGQPGGAGPCYRCLYPEPPPPELAPSCAEAGVLGVVPGIIGLLQAAETLKLLLGAGVPLVGRMLHYDGLRGRFDEFEVPRDPQCPACAR
jgi:molybdopterin/thiamine biosynthesis adenylyltransferase/rhodanese-related sulfurtransferase